MRKIKSSNIQIGMVIFAFSMMITLAFAGILIVFSGGFHRADALRAVAAPTCNTNTYAVTLSNQDAERLFSEGAFPLTPGNLASIEAYNQSYLNGLMHRIVPYAVCFCLLLFALSVGLWLVLKQIQARNNTRIVDQLNSIPDTDLFSADNPALVRAYESLKQKFDGNLNDYKRLNSYLSHEQKNAIAILRTRLELSDHPEYLADLDRISESIDDVLTLSETSEGAAKAAVDVALVCAAVCDSYQNVQEKITFTFDEHDNTEIWAKERWIYRAVSNLLSNAVKYGNGKPIEVGVRSANHSVIVTVKDRGAGIAPQDQEKIFNHRYRIHELNKDGYGIGLSLVSHVCDLCGGFATVESELGKGATFYLSFPQKAV